MTNMPANIRISAQFPFPSGVSGTTPIAITKANGIWSVALPVDALATQLPSGGSLTTDYLLVWDSLTKTYFKMPISNVPTGAPGPPGPPGATGPAGGITDAPSDGVNYGRKNASWNNLDTIYTGRYGPPGGRLTLQSGVPVMTSNQLTPQTIYYAPYLHPFVPIYNGTIIQMYNFTTSPTDVIGLSLGMAGSASWPNATTHDVFVTLVAGVPTLCTVQWTNATTRATNLAIFGGFPTNATLATARTGASTTISLAVNQGTFLGSFIIGNVVGSVTGQSIWQYGGAASGGSFGAFYLCNYYNKVQVNTIVIDNGATYTYTSATVRGARASASNAIYYIQSDSERTASFSYAAQHFVLAGGTVNTGIGVANNVFNVFATWSNATAGPTLGNFMSNYSLASVGFTSIFALESSDGSHASTFNNLSNNQLFGTIWL